MKNSTFNAIVLAVFFAITFLIFAELHGKYRDAVVGRLHKDCFMCDIYRFTNSGDAAFAIREAKRSEQRKE